MKRRAALVSLILAAACLLGVERPPGLDDVVEVRHWSYPDYTRVVVELTGPVASEVHHLAADPKMERPERLYLDLEGVWVTDVSASSPFVDEGLRPKDIITEINGEPVRGSQQLAETISEMESGNFLRLYVQRFSETGKQGFFAFVRVP